MYTYRNGLRTLTGILCIAVTIFIFTSFANADDEVQYKSYDLKGYTGSVEVDQSVQDKIQDKAIKEIAGGDEIENNPNNGDGESFRRESSGLRRGSPLRVYR